MPAGFRSRLAGLVIVASIAACPSFAAAAAPTTNPASADPAQTDEDFPFQGEYAGTLTKGGTSEKYGVQVIALGDGTFDAVGYPGGLPGDGWTPPTKLHGTGKRDGAVVNLTGLDIGGTKRQGRIEDGSLTVLDDAGTSLATFAKVTRKSPTLGQPAPTGAIVIFDGAGPADETKTLVNPRITDDGLLMEGITSQVTHGGRTKTEQPAGPLQLQNHGNPVRYRNIWVQPKS